MSWPQVCEVFSCPGYGIAAASCQTMDPIHGTWRNCCPRCEPALRALDEEARSIYARVHDPRAGRPDMFRPLEVTE